MIVYTRLGSQKISDDAPAGSDVRYEDCFLELQAEIDKLSSPTARGTFQWRTVAERSADILANHSKDLLVASYLAVSLIHIEKLQGIDAALTLYGDLLKTHWPILFPPVKRMKGRMAAFEWWFERTERAIDEAGLGKADKAFVDRVLKKLKEIEQFLTGNVDASFSLEGLSRKIRSLAIEEAPKLVVENKDSESEPAPKVEEIFSIPDASVSSVDDVTRNVIPLFQKIRQASIVLRGEKNNDPQAYRWLRFSMWESVRALPPAAGGITRVPPPPAQVLTHLGTLCRDGDWEGLLDAAESDLSSARNLFLLDINYYSYEAMTKLGHAFAEARDAVLQETVHFTNRLKGIDALAFSDKTPFADDRTREWLMSAVQNSRGHSFGHETGAQNRNPEIEEDMAVIREQLRAGADLPGVVGVLQQRIDDAGSGWEVLQFRLETARILADEKQEKMAGAQIEKILEMIDEHRLWVWDPGMTLEALKTSYRILRLNSEARYKNRASDVLAFIAKINLREAMTM
jgi:type VI secretion system protein VasJ